MPGRSDTRLLKFLTSVFLVTVLVTSPSVADQGEVAGSQNDVEKRELSLGAVVASIPYYQGGDRYNVIALPIIHYRQGRLGIDALGGVSYDFSTLSNVHFGPRLNYRFGREEDDDDALQGMGDIHGAASLGGFVRWQSGPYSLTADVSRGLSGDVTGRELKLGAGYGMPVSAVDRILLKVSVSWADEDLMQTYFGISPSQAVTSGYAQYQASAGIRQAELSATWVHGLTRQWYSTMGISIHHLGSNPADSPVVESATGRFVSAGMGYRF